MNHAGKDNPQHLKGEGLLITSTAILLFIREKLPNFKVVSSFMHQLFKTSHVFYTLVR